MWLASSKLLAMGIPWGLPDRLSASKCLICRRASHPWQPRQSGGVVHGTAPKEGVGSSPCVPPGTGLVALVSHALHPRFGSQRLSCVMFAMYQSSSTAPCNTESRVLQVLSHAQPSAPSLSRKKTLRGTARCILVTQTRTPTGGWAGA